MPTNEERREVARKLRELADGFEGVCDFELASALYLESIGRYSYSSEDVMRLADMIEPEPERTCEIDRRDPWNPFCRECGKDWDDDDWAYCPKCGAKVVEKKEPSENAVRIYEYLLKGLNDGE